MEHPADIRHRARSILTIPWHSGDVRVQDDDFEWLVQTVTDLADEVERLGAVPTHAPKTEKP